MLSTFWPLRLSKFLTGTVLMGAIFSIALTAHAQTLPITLKLLVVRVNFAVPAGGTAVYQPLTTAQLQTAYFDTTNPSSIASYYLANSGGRILFTGSVVGPFTIDPSKPFGGISNCDINNWDSQAEPLMQAAGINVSQYNYIQYLTPNDSYCASPTGLSNYGVPGVYPSPSKVTSFLFGYYYSGGGFAEGLAAHELGHTLGAGHSAYGSDDYGDHSDVMGDFWYVGGYKALGFDAPHLINAGWVDPGEVQTVSQSGTYTINSLESGTGLRILKIPKPNTSQMYYLSMRQAVGIDANMPAAYLGGASLHLWFPAPNSPSYTTHTLILPIPGDSNMAMADGSIYTDAANGITIKQLSHTASSATLSITMPGVCAPSAPTLVIAPATASGAPGSGTTYTVTLTDNDSSSCASAQFNLSNTSVLPSSVTASLSPTSMTLAPGGITTAQLKVSTSASVVPGNYPLQLAAKHTTASAAEANATAFYTVSSSCTVNLPIFSASPPSFNNGLPGTPAQYSLAVTNKDSAQCTNSTFTATPSAPAGWSVSPLAGSVTLPPGASGNIIETITPPATAGAGTTNISIPLTDAAAGAHNTNISVSYTIPACARAAPLLSLSPSSQQAGAGSQVSYVATLTNTDSAACGASTFHFSAILPTSPSGWSGSFQSAPSLTLLPGVFGILTLLVNSPAGASVGNYQVSAQANDVSVAGHAVTSVPATYAVAVIPPSLPSQSMLHINASRTHSGDASTLTWWVSSGLGSGISCSVSPASAIQSGPTNINGSDTITSWGSSASPITAQTVPVTGSMSFTLSCTNGNTTVSQSATATLIPSPVEI